MKWNEENFKMERYGCKKILVVYFLFSTWHIVSGVARRGESGSTCSGAQALGAHQIASASEAPPPNPRWPPAVGSSAPRHPHCYSRL